MKTLFTVILAIMLCVGVAVAEDMEINTTVDQVVTKLDRNKVEYTRCIITEMREKNGIPYPKTLAVMFFGEHNARAKALKAGDTIHGIASLGEYKGRQSYTWLSFAE